MRSLEVDIDGPLVARLIAKQFPQWANLPIARVRWTGTDQVIYRLGDDRAVRLPRILNAAKAVDKQQRWLPQPAPLLPLAIPVSLGKGVPDEGFPIRGRCVAGSTATTLSTSRSSTCPTQAPSSAASSRRSSGATPPGAALASGHLDHRLRRRCASIVRPSAPTPASTRQHGPASTPMEKWRDQQ
jgi:hypothetical protein